ncbi:MULTISPECIES: LysR family transcriptional regulator [Halomonas]|uniref:LysR family transcriptional regulator n=2 Tax=Halomonas TaxID=2745 RepID=A0A2N7TUI6_9GAMM|nr:MULTISPECIES: LysR family transcriptional regulator [Halomonas]MDI5934197.1 LysR family transcriptional regulator [Halomonas kalidii]PMR71849.1 LysR family transcriptional regulator [Halomonas heilongjiangensis]PXX87688.1 LysR family transcriptional regulator [Halomonas heilongjiangensis]
MDTQSLQAFLAVADSGSFSRAAEQLHLTQPAVSKRIAVLEGQIDARLFDRIGRRVTLTEAGRLLLPRARQILVMVDDSRRALGNLAGDVGGSLTLATSHHIGLHRLPPLLKAYTGRHPGVRLDLHFLDSEQAYQGVLDGELEIAVVTLAPHPDEHLEVVPIWIDRLCFVCAPDHPLVDHERLTLHELCEFDAVLPGALTFTRTLIEARFAAAGLTLPVALSTNYLETLRMMSAIGLGWSLLPEGLVTSELRVLAVDHPPIHRPLGYLVHRSRTLSNAARAMLDELEAAREPAAREWRETR